MSGKLTMVWAPPTLGQWWGRGRQSLTVLTLTQTLTWSLTQTACLSLNASADPSPVLNQKGCCTVAQEDLGESWC